MEREDGDDGAKSGFLRTGVTAAVLGKGGREPEERHVFIIVATGI